MKCALVGCAAIFAALAVSPALAQEGDAAAAAIGIDPAAPQPEASAIALHDRASTDATQRGEARSPAGVPEETVAAPQPPLVTLTLKADLTAQRLTVLEGDEVRHVWPISSGRRGHATPTGAFRPSWMTRMWYSRQYDYSPMPHSVFFNGGIAFHATAAVGLLGRPASHGCIRLAPANAAQLYALVRSHGITHTRVVVHGTPKFDEPAVARRVVPATKSQVALGRGRGGTQVSPYGRPLAAAQWFFVQ